LIDLVIWTYNSERYLRRVLERAVSVVPDKELGQLILVDGGSKDRTVKIGRELGWKTYITRKGIPFQANYALSHVKSRFFGGIEHDILLSKNWFSLIKHFEEPDVGVVQGIRFSTHPMLNTYEKFCLQKNSLEDFCISLDNHIYDADFVREIGGFPTEYPMAVDWGLRDRVEANGKQWIIDVNVESSHIRDSLWGTLKHDYRLFCGIEREDQLATMGDLRSLLLGPASALITAKYTREPMLFPYLTFHKIVRAAVMLRRYNAIKKAKKAFN
jgi:glycosyltransferase involved in cell wall biosynthesis